ncbi:type IV pilus twitching motility protein PilT [Aeromonas jandaei]|uniref:type IV pilus twitching motility protein PilT n=1 Tax=Aeromonas jandaei TaxID=650 RepID=UPI003BA3A381
MHAVSYLMPDCPAVFRNETDLNALLSHAKEIGASDIYIISQRPVTARIQGELHRLSGRILQSHEVEQVMKVIYEGDNGPTQVAIKPISKAYSFRHKGSRKLRFRCQGTGTQVNGEFAISITLRELPAVPRKLNKSELGDLYDMLFPDVGLVLVCGETGSGKSTLMAGIVRELIEKDDHHHILEYSQPIEYVYDDLLFGKHHVEVEQSEVPTNIPTFAEAISDALRRDPDIILVGEARDSETIKAALLAAQTGHTVYSTVHANTVGSVFLRLLQSLPTDSSAMILGGLIDSIRTIVCQDLIKTLTGERAAIRESLSFNQALRDELLLAAQNDIMSVPLIAKKMVKDHGVTKLDAVKKLVAAGAISEQWIGLYERDYE